MTDPKIPPVVADVARQFFRGLGRIGHRVLSAAVAEGLRATSEITEEVDRRVKRGAQQATRMADGHPYEKETEDDDAR